MGIKGLWDCFGVNGGTKNKEMISKIDIKGKKVAYEIAGDARENVRIACRDMQNAKQMSIRSMASKKHV